jgi:hypothetical protein
MTVLWERCESHEWCVNIPFDGKKCVGARACVRLIEDNARYYLEIEIAGIRQRVDLGDTCVEARWYVFAAKVCLANVQQTSGSSVSFDVVLRLCVDVKLGPIHIGECLDLFRQHVDIHYLKEADLKALGLSLESVPAQSRKTDGAYAYVETAISKKADSDLDKALAK